MPVTRNNQKEVPSSSGTEGSAGGSGTRLFWFRPGLAGWSAVVPVPWSAERSWPAPVAGSATGRGWWRAWLRQSEAGPQWGAGPRWGSGTERPWSAAWGNSVGVAASSGPRPVRDRAGRRPDAHHGGGSAAPEPRDAPGGPSAPPSQEGDRPGIRQRHLVPRVAVQGGPSPTRSARDPRAPGSAHHRPHRRRPRDAP